MLLPPKTWTENGIVHEQRVSPIPPTLLDVIALQQQLDTQLRVRKANENGIDPTRRELYNQAFDELIRHTAIMCSERGLLFALIRDEIRMTIAAYKTLYESSVAFGMRKALSAEQHLVDLETEAKKLNTQIAELETRKAAAITKQAEVEAANEVLFQELVTKHAAEQQSLSSVNKALLEKLTALLAPKK